MRSRGFTLIELLVVLVIIGVLVTYASLSLPDNRDEELQREARRLHAVVALAGEEAILKGGAIGIRFEQNGYFFSVPDGSGGWRPVEDDRFLRPHELPEPLRLDAVIDGLNANAQRTEDQRNRPQVLLLASGEMIPFEATLSHPDLERYYIIEGQLDGKLDFRTDE